MSSLWYNKSRVYTKEDIFMFESKYSKLLTVLLILGIILIVLILSVTGFFIIRNGKLKKEAEEAVGHFQGQVNQVESPTPENTEISNNITPDIEMENDIIPSGNSSTNDKLPTYEGFPMVGTIEIPAIKLSCPILQDATPDSMEVSVGLYDRFSEPDLNAVGNTTIAGHNYRDGRFFANNKKLVEGDKIYITDYKGKKVTYSIYKIYTTAPEDDSHLGRDTEGKSEITLVTCTDDTQSRLVVMAKEQ